MSGACNTECKLLLPTPTPLPTSWVDGVCIDGRCRMLLAIACKSERRRSEIRIGSYLPSQKKREEEMYGDQSAAPSSCSSVSPESAPHKEEEVKVTPPVGTGPQSAAPAGFCCTCEDCQQHHCQHKYPLPPAHCGWVQCVVADSSLFPFFYYYRYLAAC